MCKGYLESSLDLLDDRVSHHGLEVVADDRVAGGEAVLQPGDHGFVVLPQVSLNSEHNYQALFLSLQANPKQMSFKALNL